MSFEAGQIAARRRSFHLPQTPFTRALLAVAALLFCLHHAQAEAAWTFSWVTDAETGEYACSAASDPVSVRKDGAESVLRLGIRGNGLMTIQSDGARFAPDMLYAMWERVDENPLTVHLDLSPDGRTLTFTEDDSITLHRQFEAGSSVSISVAFSPRGPAIVRTFSLDGYGAVAAQFKGCRGLLMNPGWMGLSMNDAPENDPALAWITANTSHRTAGILIMTVDPRKEAFRSDLRPGDRIIGANGVDASVASFIGSLKTLPVGGTIALEVLRDDAILRKTIARPPAAERSRSAAE